jgi:hypothetical protein
MCMHEGYVERFVYRCVEMYEHLRLFLLIVDSYGGAKPPLVYRA